MNPLKNLDRGEKIEIHLRLYERELAILDALAQQYNCGRAAVVGALLSEYMDADLTGKVREGSQNRGPARRR